MTRPTILTLACPLCHRRYCMPVREAALCPSCAAGLTVVGAWLGRVE